MGGRILSFEELDSRRCGAWMLIVPTEWVGHAGGIGQTMWPRVVVLQKYYLDGVLGRPSLPAPCESKSICFKAWS